MLTSDERKLAECNSAIIAIRRADWSQLEPTLELSRLADISDKMATKRELPYQHANKQSAFWCRYYLGTLK